MLKYRLLFLVLCLTACVPATLPPPTGTAALPPPTREPAPSETQPPTHTPDTPLPEPTATQTPVPTQSEWELAQEQVSRLRNLLDSYSDGYNGLSIALEQTSPTKAWCDGLTMAINDFDYLKDVDNSKILQKLKDTHQCP